MSGFERAMTGILTLLFCRNLVQGDVLDMLLALAMLFCWSMVLTERSVRG